MSYYTDLRRSDVIDWLQPLLDNKTYKCRLSDGQFEMVGATRPTSSPWHHIAYSQGADCPYLHQQLFSVISPRTPAGQFVPSRCQSCWKIVMRPKTLKQLFALDNLLIQLGWPSKCGIERRSYTPPAGQGERYGGYIYNQSKEEGLERLDSIRKHLAEFPGLEDVKCYLKRACTEMEMTFPDSTTWEVSEEQKRVEDILDWLLVFDIPAATESRHMVDKIYIDWIEWACENGDETYLEYTDGKPIYCPAVRYERPEEVSEVSSEGETVSISPSSGEAPKGIALLQTKEKE